MVISLGMIAICLCAPMILMVILAQKESRRIIFVLMVGMLTCVISSKINGFLMEHMEVFYLRLFNIYYAPIVEECVKFVPVFLYSIVAVRRGKYRIEYGMAVGVGFSILENVYYMLNNIKLISSWEWIFSRGFATALMHALCAAAVSYTLHISFQYRKMFLTGTMAALAMAMTYHSIFNALIYTKYKDIIIFVPITTYLILLLGF